MRILRSSPQYPSDKQLRADLRAHVQKSEEHQISIGGKQQELAAELKPSSSWSLTSKPLQ